MTIFIELWFSQTSDCDVWLWTRYLSQRLWRIYSINEYLFIVIKWIYCFSISCIEIETRSRFFFFDSRPYLSRYGSDLSLQGNHYVKKYLNVSLIDVESDRLLVLYFDVQLSSFKNTGYFKHWKIRLCNSFEVSSSLQFCPTLCLIYQNKSCITSFLIQVPRNTNDRDKIYELYFQLQENSVAFSPHNFIEHGHEDDSIDEVLKFTLYTFNEFLNFFEDVYRRESSEDFPLEFRLHIIDTIQFLEVIVLRIPFNFIHPSCVLDFLSSRPCKVLSRRRHRLWQ